MRVSEAFHTERERYIQQLTGVRFSPPEPGPRRAYGTDEDEWAVDQRRRAEGRESGENRTPVSCWIIALAALYLGYGIRLSQEGIEDGRAWDWTWYQFLLWWLLAVVWGPLLIAAWVHREYQDWSGFIRGWSSYFRSR